MSALLMFLVVCGIILMALIFAYQWRVKAGGADGGSIVFVTGNSNKAAEVAAILGANITNKAADLIEIQSLDVEEVVKSKLQDAKSKIKDSKLIVEDTGLLIDLGGDKLFPGALIKSYIEALGIPLIGKLHNGARARAVTVIGYFDGAADHYFVGETKGKITEPRGEGGFGWDPIFMPEGGEKTFAELSGVAKNEVSMRRRALEKFREHLAVLEK